MKTGKAPKDEDRTDRTPRRRVMIVDDHPLVRQGLVAMINQQPDLEVSHEASTADTAFAILERERPDVMVVDLVLEGMSGVELIKNVHAVYPDLPLLALSMHDEKVYAERALRAGALGYVMKHEHVDRVLEAIRRVLGGEPWFSERLSGILLQDLVRTGGGGKPRVGMDQLSDRELEVFEAIGAGLSTGRIADQLRVSVKTVETHRAAIKRKLHLKSSIDLIRHATLWSVRPDR